jgi:hypothetical protein
MPSNIVMEKIMSDKKHSAYDTAGITAAVQKLADCFAVVAAEKGVGPRTVVQAVQRFENLTKRKAEDVFQMASERDENILKQSIHQSVERAGKGGDEVARQIYNARVMDLIL